MNKIKQVIIKTDGGICSQIAFCALGKHFEDLRYKVKYDISWFKEYGEKLNGVNVRNYIVEKVFPALNFEIVTQEEISYYKKHFNIHQNIQDLQDKMYIDGYPAQRESLFIKYLEYFKANFKPLGIENMPNELYCKNFENIYIINKPGTIGKALKSDNYLNEYKKFKRRYKRSCIIITILSILLCVAIFLGVK